MYNVLWVSYFNCLYAALSHQTLVYVLDSSTLNWSLLLLGMNTVQIIAHTIGASFSLCSIVIYSLYSIRQLLNICLNTNTKLILWKYLAKRAKQGCIYLFRTWECTHVESNIPELECSKVFPSQNHLFTCRWPMFEGLESNLKQCGSSLMCLGGYHICQEGLCKREIKCNSFLLSQTLLEKQTKLDYTNNNLIPTDFSLPTCGSAFSKQI